jgi:hypothetical protein
MSMMLRHSAALALVVWYLTSPPVDKNNSHVIDANAPLATWVRIALPDKEFCESAVKTLRTDGANPSTQSPKGGNSRTLTSSEFRKKLLGAQCIASDDPRLKEK